MEGGFMSDLPAPQCDASIPVHQSDEIPSALNDNGHQLYQSLIPDLETIGESQATAEQKQSQINALNTELHALGFPADLAIVGLNESGEILVDNTTDNRPPTVESERAFSLSVNPVDQAILDDGAGYRINRDGNGQIESLDLMNRFGVTSSWIRDDLGMYVLNDPFGNPAEKSRARGREIRPRSDGRVEIAMEKRGVHVINPDGTSVTFWSDEHKNEVGLPEQVVRGNGDLYTFGIENGELVQQTIARTNGETERWIKIGDEEWQELESGRTITNVEVSATSDGTVLVTDTRTGATEFRMIDGSSIWTDAHGKVIDVAYAKNPSLTFTITEESEFVGYTQRINGQTISWVPGHDDPNTTENEGNLFVLASDS